MREFRGIIEIADFIQSFENKYSKELLEDKYRGWLAWQIVRKPLYFYLKRKCITNRKNRTVKKRLRQHLRIKCSILKISLNYRTYRNNPLVLTHPRYDEMFTSILNSQNGNFLKIYTASSTDSECKELISIDRAITSFTRFFKLLGLVFFSNIKLIANKQSTLINKALSENGYSISVPAKEIKRILIEFTSREVFYYFLLDLLRPKCLLLVDSVGSGVMAAANKTKIPVYEFQHGFFHKSKPDYHMPLFFKNEEKQIISPKKIVVFGKAFQNALTEYGFWSNEHIFILGNYKINKLRTQNSEDKQIPNAILLITQPSCFEQWKKVCEYVTKPNFKSHSFFLKIHPNETKEAKKWYKEFVRINNDCHYFENNESIYSLIQKTQVSIGFHSTALLEALALNRPVIAINANSSKKYPFEEYILPNEKLDNLLLIDNIEEITTNLINVFSKKSDTINLKSTGYFFDLKYPDNLENLINIVLNNESENSGEC